MKKFYFLIMAMMVSLCASAIDYQLCGGVNGWNTTDASTVFTDQGDGTYKLELAQLTSGFKIKSFESNWNDAYNYGAKSASDKLEPGTAMALTNGSGSQNINLAAPVDNAVLIFNPSEATLLLQGEEGTSEITYVLHGSWNGSATWTDLELFDEDGVWATDAVLTATSNFGIKKLENGKQIAWIASSGTGEVAVNEANPCKVDGTNFTIGAGEYEIYFDPEAMTLTVEGEGDDSGEDPIPPTPVDEFTYAIHGSITGNTAWETIGLTKNAEGNWEYTGSFVDGSFGIKKLDENGAQAEWIGGAADITSADQAYTFTAGADSKSSLTGTYTFIYDPAASTVMFKTYEGEITVVKSYQIRGTIVDGGTDWNDYDLTETDGVWSAELTVVPGSFGIKYNENDSQKAWYSAAGDAEIAAAGEYAAMINGTNWTSTLEGTYTFTFDPATETLTIKGDEDPIPPTPVVDYTKWYVTFGVEGDDASWNAGVQCNAEGVATGSIEVAADAQGKIKVWDNEADHYYSTADEIALGAPAMLSEAVTTSFALPAATAGKTISWTYDVINNALTITVAEEVVTRYFIHGQFAAPEAANALADEAQWYDYEFVDNGEGLVATVTATVAEGHFLVYKDVNGTQTWYKAAAGTVMPSDSPVILGTDGDDIAFNATVGSSYIFKLDPETMGLTMTVTTGIEGVEADAQAEAVYYNLQGVRVQPAAGQVYIVVRGDKVAKEYVR